MYSYEPIKPNYVYNKIHSLSEKCLIGYGFSKRKINTFALSLINVQACNEVQRRDSG